MRSEGMAEVFTNSSREPTHVHCRLHNESPEKTLLHLFLGAEVVGVAAGLLAAVGGTGRKPSVAAAANLLLPVELLGEGNERGLHDTTAQTKHQVQGRVLLDVVVAERAALLELLTGEDQALLIRRDALLLLNLALDILDRVVGLDFEGNGLASKCFDEDLHRSTPNRETKTTHAVMLPRSQKTEKKNSFLFKEVDGLDSHWA